MVALQVDCKNPAFLNLSNFKINYLTEIIRAIKIDCI